MMETEIIPYISAYTGEEIDRRLGLLDEIAVSIEELQEKIDNHQNCLTQADLDNALEYLPKRCYVNEIPRGLDLHPMGENNSPNGDFSITSGQYNTASGNFSSAYGYYNRATNLYSFAMGYGNKSYESYAIAIGTQNNASGFASIAIGQDNTATKDFSLAIGKNSNAKANFSLAIGEHCIASGESQTVLGKYNIADNNDKYAFIIGSGDSDKNRSNALTLDWNGNLWTAGDITATNSDGETVSLCEMALAVSDLQNANAPTATKLQTARQINGVAFDGSKDITVPIRGCYHYDDSANATTVSWHRVASCTLNRGSYDAHAVFHVYRSLGRTPYGGILKAHIRTTPEGLHENSQLVWEYAYNIPKEDFVLSVIQNETDKSTTAELWVKINIRYAGYQFALLSESNRTTARNGIWTLYNSSVGQSTYTESGIVTVSDFMKIQNQIETSDSGWIQIPINLGNGEVYYRKYGKMVELRGSLSPNINNEWSVCTLPSNCCPSIRPVETFVIGNSPRNLTISTDGTITISNVVAHELIKLQTTFLIDELKVMSNELEF